MKDVVFIDSALEDPRAFPPEARREAGYQIDLVQQGLEPSDWKPIKAVGSVVREIRIHEAGEHRVLYVAGFEEAVYVLHAFQKKTQKTAKKDIELARKRFKALSHTRKMR
jgi:phage-related protein